ncbi:hypothetical protein H5410_062150 [Solanum commersonii]|uniref:Uncharacterized protein n=1 Tax=Solanum commersonii TaxID=4109 RepID=A0A9J5WBE1_SOLCO|nr:hypothetical protein H5410_062150 [Solanum commersonii]
MCSRKIKKYERLSGSGEDDQDDQGQNRKSKKKGQIPSPSIFLLRVASFTSEKQVVANYNESLIKHHHSDSNESYALAIWYGARFISRKGYTAGQVLNVFDSKLLHEIASDLLFERLCLPA